MGHRLCWLFFFSPLVVCLNCLNTWERDSSQEQACYWNVTTYSLDNRWVSSTFSSSCLQSCASLVIAPNLNLILKTPEYRNNSTVQSLRTAKNLKSWVFSVSDEAKNGVSILLMHWLGVHRRHPNTQSMRALNHARGRIWNAQVSFIIHISLNSDETASQV